MARVLQILVVILTAFSGDRDSGYLSVQRVRLFGELRNIPGVREEGWRRGAVANKLGDKASLLLSIYGNSL